MNFTTMFNFNSKTFWMGVAMVAAGVAEAIGVPFVVDFAKMIWPNLTPDVLITTGVGMMFIRDAITKLAGK